MEQPELKIYEVETDSLLPYANNAKKHGEGDIDSLVASIERFGFCDPVGVWENPEGETEIVEGHGRVLALKKLGIGKVPVIYLNHLSDEQRRAYTHVHNQTTMNTGFDFDILDAEMEMLDFDWESFGFDIPDIEWDKGLGELTDDTYEPPDMPSVKCPSCGYVGAKEYFKTV